MITPESEILSCEVINKVTVTTYEEKTVFSGLQNLSKKERSDLLNGLFEDMLKRAGSDVDRDVINDARRNINIDTCDEIELHLDL
jgi:5-methylthioribose kinase